MTKSNSFGYEVKTNIIELDCKSEIYIGSISPSFELFTPVRNIHGFKPIGGLWTSNYRDSENLSEWVKWCKSEVYECDPGLGAYLVVPKKDAKLLIVDSIESLNLVYSNYKLTYEERPLSFEDRLDYEKMKSDSYDGFKLVITEELREPELSNINVWNLVYSYCVSSTVWFDWVFDEIIDLKINPYEIY